MPLFVWTHNFPDMSSDLAIIRLLNLLSKVLIFYKYFNVYNLSYKV